MTTQLHKLGLTPDTNAHFEVLKAARDGALLARVLIQFQGCYHIQTEDEVLLAETSGRIRHKAHSAEDFPAVGDWVLAVKADDQLAIIYDILPRKNVLERRAVDQLSDIQLIAANIDTAFIVQSMDHGLNMNRLERYLHLMFGHDITPVIVVNKIDLSPEDQWKNECVTLQKQHPTLRVLATSIPNDVGLDELRQCIVPKESHVFIGSSGVGKSSLMNAIAPELGLKTNVVSAQTGKGMHTTRHRELFLASNGGIIIDTPGMRELGITDTEKGIAESFEVISELAKDCKYRNCSHTQEPGCKVLEAVARGQLDRRQIDHIAKLEKEKKDFALHVKKRSSKKGKKLDS